MSADSSAPATKADIRMLMDEIGRLYDANQRWKDDILAANPRWKNEIIDHFDLLIENIRHDLTSANREEIELLKDARANHETRIGALERAVGLPA